MFIWRTLAVELGACIRGAPGVGTGATRPDAEEEEEAEVEVESNVMTWFLDG